VLLQRGQYKEAELQLTQVCASLEHSVRNQSTDEHPRAAMQKFANRWVRFSGGRSLTRGRFATPADSLQHDCSPYSHAHVRRDSGFVHRSRDHFSAAPCQTLRVSIRNLVIAVPLWVCPSGSFTSLSSSQHAASTPLTPPPPPDAGGAADRDARGRARESAQAGPGAALPGQPLRAAQRGGAGVAGAPAGREGDGGGGRLVRAGGGAVSPRRPPAGGAARALRRSAGDAHALPGGAESAARRLGKMGPNPRFAR
jgi:hypothetical protein